MNLKEQILQIINSNYYLAFSMTQLQKALKISSKEDFVKLSKAVVELEEDLDIIIINDKIFSRMNPNYLIGKLIAKKNTRSFISVNESSVAISNFNLKEAIYLDTVLLEYNRRKNDYQVLKVLKRELTSFVGEYVSSKNYLKPDNDNIGDRVILEKVTTPYQIGTKLEVKVTKVLNQRVYGEVIRVLGHKNDVGVDILSKIIEHDVKYNFDEETIAEAERFGEEIDKKEYSKRRDLTKQLVFTIDGEDAKDLDDAISIEILENGNYSLIVSIADVSYYVKKNSYLDKEAYQRGTSIYLVNKVIPMLPPNLSNGICSLHPGVKRLTISCQVEISKSGNIVGFDIFPSIICSKYRLSYNQVNQFFATGELGIDSRELKQALTISNQLAKSLFAIRNARGSINIVTSEAKFIVDEKEKIVEIQKRTSKEAELLIEELMITANEVVAMAITNLHLPFIYRIHEPPTALRTDHLILMLRVLKYSIPGVKGKTLTPKQYQAVLSYYQGKPEETILNSLILRSLAKAKYSANNLGHFGLASTCYSHFTSPIRRYPDLLVHRLLREYLFEHTFDSKKWNSQVQYIVDIAEQSSMAEKKAVSLERDVEQMKKAEYMHQFINQRFPAVISALTNFGMFVELENTVQGLIRYANMENDYYQYDESRLVVQGNYSKKSYRIGDRVLVQLINSDKDSGEIDFILVKKL